MFEFLSIGSQFDEQGNLKEMYDVQTQNNLDKREQCFIDEYNKCCESGKCVSTVLRYSDETKDLSDLMSRVMNFSQVNSSFFD